MLKRILGILVVLTMMLTGSALAVVATDAPGTPTQDVVLALNANWLDEEQSAYDLKVMPADQATVDTVTAVFEFVYSEGNRPVRYFPEETQQAIAEMIDGVSPDSLYITEFMRLNAAAADAVVELNADMLLDIDYQPGQLVVVVLGDASDPDNIVWTPVEAQVTETGKVSFVIPQALIEQLQGKDIFFSLLTVRGASSGRQEEKVETKDYPSKTAQDIVKVVDSDFEKGTLIDDLEVIVIEESELIVKEHEKIHDHLKIKDQPINAYLPETSQNEIQLLLNQTGKGTQKEDLVLYEYVGLITRNYKDTTGDIAATFTFAVPYTGDTEIVTMLGLPKEGAVDADPTLMDWAVQRAKINPDGTVEVVFGQLAMSEMGEKTGLLLVLSEPLAE